MAVGITDDLVNLQNGSLREPLSHIPDTRTQNLRKQGPRHARDTARKAQGALPARSSPAPGTWEPLVKHWAGLAGATGPWGRGQTRSCRPAPRALARTPMSPPGPRPGPGAWGACSRLRSGRGVVSLVTARPGRTPPRHRGARATALLPARAVSCAAPAPAAVPAPLGRPGVGGHGEQGRDGILRGTHSPPRGPGPRPVRAAAHRGGALGSGRGLPVTGSRAAAGARLVSRYRAVSGPPLGSRRLSARDSAGRAAR